MRLSKLTVKNFRSIKSAEGIRIEPLQAFVGENNAGKSNFLKAINCFLNSGTGGVGTSDFNNPESEIEIEAEFSGLSDQERRGLRPYLLGDRLILQKSLSIEVDARTQKPKITTEYRGYQAEPQNWWLSMSKIEEREGNRPNWRNIAEANGLLAYIDTPDERVNKTNYKSGLDRYLTENEVEYDEPALGETQALGFQSNLLSKLPRLYLLPAITDYSNEIDRRSSSTVFRQLMGHLSDRIIKTDPRYSEFEDALNKLRSLLNVPADPEIAEGQGRLGALGSAEESLTGIVGKLMPGVKGIQLEVTIEEPKELFSRGVTMKVDDGVLTDVLDKGHGLQRSVVFGLLQMLIQTSRENDAEDDEDDRPIILCIEEPELYIHPQCQRLIFNVLKNFAGVTGGEEIEGTDQVLYTTHSPAMIDVGFYERVAIVRKDSLEEGTVARQCQSGALGDLDERKGFKLLTSFSLKHNELFFAKEIILVEGQEDEIAVIATARKLGRVLDLPDEIGLAVVVTQNKESIPKFQKILNAFGLRYSVLLELDGHAEAHDKNAGILGLLNDNRVAKIPGKLEDLLGLDNHFRDVFQAKTFFSDPNNINADCVELITSLLPETV
ncbi:MAG: AAA family ATPase [Hyphomonas sp.]|uniref:ATP-dependent nuclease n=1 Tax=Hyphomonas sp. TaxID=87 RepID=UPI003001460F